MPEQDAPGRAVVQPRQAHIEPRRVCPACAAPHQYRLMLCADQMRVRSSSGSGDPLAGSISHRYATIQRKAELQRNGWAPKRLACEETGHRRARFCCQYAADDFYSLLA